VDTCAISRSRQLCLACGSECDVCYTQLRSINTAHLVGAGVANLGPGTPAAPAIPHAACVCESELCWWGGGRSAPLLEHLTALRSVVGRAAGPAHHAALTDTGWRAAGHAARRRERGRQQQRRSVDAAGRGGPIRRRRPRGQCAASSARHILMPM